MSGNAASVLFIRHLPRVPDFILSLNIIFQRPRKNRKNFLWLFIIISFDCTICFLLLLFDRSFVILSICSFFRFLSSFVFVNLFVWSPISATWYDFICSREDKKGPALIIFTARVANNWLKNRVPHWGFMPNLAILKINLPRPYDMYFKPKMI